MPEDRQPQQKETQTPGEKLRRDFEQYKQAQQESGNKDNTTLWVNFLLTREDSTMDSALPRTIEDQIDAFKKSSKILINQGQTEEANKQIQMQNLLQQRFNSMFITQETPNGSVFRRTTAPIMDPIE